MLNRPSRLRQWKIPLISLLFIIILISLRVVWLFAFSGNDYPNATNGVLDLRNYDHRSNKSITLDGDWEFYPNYWIYENSDAANNENHNIATNDSSNKMLITVPGSWNNQFETSKHEFGYGSYRLLLQVDPDRELNYSLNIPSVRSSSKLFVNGRLLGSSGEPASHKEGYVARNIPYIATFNTEGKDTVEIVLQAANYTDPRASGIIRSIRIGNEHTIRSETQFSIIMQIAIASAFFIHMVYSIIMYFVGYRDNKLLYFALLVLALSLNLLTSTEDKILLSWLPITLDRSINLITTFLAIGTFALYKCMIDFLPSKWYKVISPWITAFCGIALLLTFILPTSGMESLQYLLMFVVFVIIIVSLGQLIVKGLNGGKTNLWMILTIIAVTHYFIWYLILLSLKLKLPFYPIDLIVATICFATIWLRRYRMLLSEANNMSARLKKSDKQKDEFLTNTSHELRNPLHSILNISQSVLEREQLSLSHKSILDLELVLTVGRRMSLMLDDLIDITRLKESHVQLQQKPFSIQSVSNGVLDMLRFMAEPKQLQLHNHIPEHFPKVYGDENRIIQILFNLLHNAVKFTHSGEVCVRAYINNKYAYISVTDTGPGLNKDEQERIFEPYEQMEDALRISESGFGLGLHISKQLAELHGGRLTVDTKTGQGSRFTFTLPLADMVDAAHSTSNSIFDSIDPIKSTHTASSNGSFDAFGLAKSGKSTEPMNSTEKLIESIRSTSNSKQQVAAAVSSTPELSKKQMRKQVVDKPRILIVDDDPVNLKVLENILGSDHYELTLASSGYEALDQINEREWDLVISDVMMPQMSGYELTKRIRKRLNLSELPILLLTARNRSEDIRNGFLAGANDYAAKPVDAAELRSRVQALTEVKKIVRDRLRVEAAWLQAQIQPHFLFNTLNAIAALSTIDLDRMRKLIDAFSQFLRDKFSFHNMDEWISIEEELNIVRSYLYIEEERFRNRLNIVWEIDDCRPFLIPPLTIQPLVENAVKHGVLKQPEAGTIHIRLKNYDSYIEISISDNGVGMNEELVQSLFELTTARSSGIGLINTNLRLKRSFGKGLQIRSKPGYGTTVSFTINSNIE